MMTRCMTTAAALTVLLQIPAAAAEPDGARVLKLFVGNWQAELAGKPSKWNPDGAKNTVHEHTSLILKDRFVLTRSVSQPDGVKGTWLMKYEPMTKSYPAWFFNSKGLLGGQWAATWEEGSRTLTFRAIDLPTGWTSIATNRFPDGKSNHIAYWIKDAAGTPMIDASGKKARQDAAAGKKILARWSKTERSGAPLYPEMQVLERLNGSWTFTAVAQPAEWTPKVVRTAGSLTRTWALNRSVVLETSKSSDKTEGMSLFTYDRKQKAYRSWWFSSEGHTSKSTGQWDGVTETLSMRTDLDDGKVLRTAIRIIDKDHHDARVVVKDGDGKLYFDTKWTVTRRHAGDHDHTHDHKHDGHDHKHNKDHPRSKP